MASQNQPEITPGTSGSRQKTEVQPSEALLTLAALQIGPTLHTNDNLGESVKYIIDTLKLLSTPTNHTAYKAENFDGVLTIVHCLSHSLRSMHWMTNDTTAISMNVSVKLE